MEEPFTDIAWHSSQIGEMWEGSGTAQQQFLKLKFCSNPVAADICKNRQKGIRWCMDGYSFKRASLPKPAKPGKTLQKTCSLFYLHSIKKGDCLENYRILQNFYNKYLCHKCQKMLLNIVIPKCKWIVVSFHKTFVRLLK